MILNKPPAATKVMTSKKVLAIYYTQTGQLSEIMDSFTQPLVQAGVTVEKLLVQPEQPFVFPWKASVFFDKMPDCVFLQPVPLQPFTPKETKYDLIIFGYQPWFLSPSLPANSILQHPAFKAVAANTPVVTISGCRNMWLIAQEKVKLLLQQANANLVGNIAIVDRHNNYVSLVTIVHWLLYGRTDRKWGIFPKPGVTPADIDHASVFGSTVLQHLQQESWTGLQPALVAQKAVRVRYHLMFFEHKGAHLFPIWAKQINKRKKNRAAWVTAFKYYLLFALCVVAPTLYVVDFVLFRVFKLNRIKKQQQYYSGVALK